MSRTTGISSPIRKKSDSYITPQWCIDALVKSILEEGIRVPTGGFVCDLGAGDGRIGRTVSYALDSTGEDIRRLFVESDTQNMKHVQLREDWNFTDYLSKDYMNFIGSLNSGGIFVSNPPFSLSDQFVPRTCGLLDNLWYGSIAVFLLRLNWLGSAKRASWINSFPPEKITILAPRPSFTEGGTDACEYAWIWWTKKDSSLQQPSNFRRQIEVRTRYEVQPSEKVQS